MIVRLHSDPLGHWSPCVSLAHAVNGVGVEGMRHLCTALSTLRSLVTLNVRGNDVGDAGATALASALAHCPSLVNVNAGGCRIGDVGVALLAEAIKSAPSLASLDLSSACSVPTGYRVPFTQE